LLGLDKNVSNNVQLLFQRLKQLCGADARAKKESRLLSLLVLATLPFATALQS